MSTAVKCVHCNIVINEVLAFVQSKIDVMDEESITRLCIDTFTEKEIDAAKDLLFDSVSSIKKITRKGDRKCQRNIQDIISTLKAVDPENIPIFVAKELHRLPPVTFDHIDVTRLLKDIIIMQNELKIMKTNYATIEQVSQLRSEIENIKLASIVNNFECNINTRRGGYFNRDDCELDSGPMGLLLNNSNSTANIDSSAARCQFQQQDDSSNRKMQSEITQNISADSNTGYIDTGEAACHSQVVQPLLNTQPSIVLISPESPTTCNDNKSNCDSVTLKKTLSMADIVRKDNINKNNENWTLVKKHKRNKNHFTGKIGKAVCDRELNFKAADKKVPMYITNVHKETAERSIVDYILNKTGEQVTLIKLSIKNENKYNAYKFFVPTYKLSVFLNETLWPAGIVFRRFVHKKYGTADRRPDTILNKQQ
ncbi:uncharacterized protein LOC131842821 [Achroia grisella]|uniref:uncharacterized protein LOC131842821 n=1 Tax=Achroia grisella TaxID=688607 RepID=UPI0027D283DA|nr:uncharacterized protein LOC131842821 [Achroia grisella]